MKQTFQNMYLALFDYVDIHVRIETGVLSIYAGFLDKKVAGLKAILELCFLFGTSRYWVHAGFRVVHRVYALNGGDFRPGLYTFLEWRCGDRYARLYPASERHSIES